jgi:hypothetical protein
LLITKYFIGGAPFFYPLFQFTQSSLSCPNYNMLKLSTLNIPSIDMMGLRRDLLRSL